MVQSSEVKIVVVPGKHKDLSAWIQSGGKTDKMAILLPGFLDSGNYPHLRDLSSRLSQAGYVCVRFDPPGTWTNGKDISDYRLTSYVQAVLDIYLWAKREFSIKQCVLAGHSFGGVVSLVAATKLPDISAVVAIMSPANLTAAINWSVGETRKSTRQEPDNPKKNREFIVPYSFAQDVDGYDIPAIAATIKCPTLFVAAELDTVVLPSEVEKLAKCAQQGSYLLLNKVKHGYWSIPEQVKVVDEAVMDFLREKQLA